jgi:hypothetical protein
MAKDEGEDECGMQSDNLEVPKFVANVPRLKDDIEVLE